MIRYFKCHQKPKGCELVGLGIICVAFSCTCKKSTSCFCVAVLERLPLGLDASFEPHIKKTCFCISTNKGADQLHGKHSSHVSINEELQ